MDALSDLLRVVRLKGAVFLHAEFTTPWCIFSQVTPQDCRPLLDGAEHMVPYHYVVEGRLSAQIPNHAPVEVEAGEVIVFPHNDGHLLGSHLDLPPVPSRQVVRVSPESGLFVIRHGGGGPRTRVVCGFLGCDRLDGNPLAAALPPILRFDARHGSAASWIRSSFEFAADEIAARRAGSGTCWRNCPNCSSSKPCGTMLRHFRTNRPDGSRDSKTASCLGLWGSYTAAWQRSGPSMILDVKSVCHVRRSRSASRA
jgi:AraC family transcriptional regulator, alkane utilization regulator